MVAAQNQPWSDNPNAPKISRAVYFDEKASFAGILIASMLYGTSKAFLPTRPPIDIDLVCSFYSRNPHRGVFPVHGRAA